ncbi:hypothetical protein KDL29_01800 [bacterium]|nr:hypothetical protein [bacterium]
MTTVASSNTLNVEGIFGASGRYFRFSRPLELQIELDEEGLWHHRLPALNLWTYEPDRNDSLRGLQEFLDSNYETFCLSDEQGLESSALAYRKQLLELISSVY